ncbi:MAG: chromosomal replication initiator protein DnaA [Thermomicrobiales bacterium]
MQAHQLWQAVLGDMQVRLSKGAFENWLRHTNIVGFEDDVATVAAANTFSASTLQARYAPQIEQAISDIVGRPIQVRFVVQHAALGDDTASPDAARPTPRATPPSRSTPDRPPSRPSRAPDRANGASRTAAASSGQQLPLSSTPNHGLNPRYVYDNYVVGASNRFAHAASLSVAEHPGGKFNPFFVHGGVGLGKTHLLHAIGHRALELQPDLSVTYVSSEKFTNDLIKAIRAQQMEEFRARYRTIDLLMIDDIQFIAGKESTQEEFFHTFNTLYQGGKQVVISSDKPPKSIAALAERLRSRFEGGLIADVGFPDYEMRTAILRGKAEELGARLPDDVAEYVAQRDQSNIREVEGALNRILFLAQTTERPLTLDLAMEALTDSAAGARRSTTRPTDVVEAVASHFGVSLKELRGRGRSKEIVGPRQVAMYLMREETGASLSEIGHALGDRDHTTVMHGIAKIERDLATDTTLRANVMSVREALFTAGGRR